MPTNKNNCSVHLLICLGNVTHITPYMKYVESVVKKNEHHITPYDLSMIVKLMTAPTFKFSWRFSLLSRIMVFHKFDLFCRRTII